LQPQRNFLDPHFAYSDKIRRVRLRCVIRLQRGLGRRPRSGPAEVQRRWRGELHETAEGRAVIVIEGMRHGRRYTTPLDAGSTGEALVEVALVERDPQGYVSRRTEGPRCAGGLHRARERPAVSRPPQANGKDRSGPQELPIVSRPMGRGAGRQRPEDRPAPRTQADAADLPGWPRVPDHRPQVALPPLREEEGGLTQAGGSGSGSG